MGDSRTSRGMWYVAGGWTFTGLAFITVLLRIYTRMFLTRSMGSDDMTIIIALLPTIAGSIIDTFSTREGLGQHIQYLSKTQVERIEGFEYTGWVRVFISYFFIRLSIMLFTLRLLPCTKRWPRRVIHLVLFVNFAITLAACICYGIRCTPMAAIWKSVPNAKCRSIAMFTTSQQVHGVLACIIDITTAAIPAFLLWDLKMKRSTKVVLDTIFALGLITAGLSIGRVVTTKNSTWQSDMTYNAIVNGSFSFVEEKLGIFLASCPVVRQFVTYVLRNRTLMPMAERLPRNNDFKAMRKRIALRDILWYRQARLDRSRDTAARLMASQTRSGEAVEVKYSGLDHMWVKSKAFFKLGRTPRGIDVEKLAEGDDFRHGRDVTSTVSAPRPVAMRGRDDGRFQETFLLSHDTDRGSDVFLRSSAIEDSVN